MALLKEVRLFGDLTPCVPLSLIRRGGDFEKRGYAPLKHPHVTNPEQGELKRGEASLIYPFPLPLDKGKGDKGGWGYQIKPKESEFLKE